MDPAPINPLTHLPLITANPSSISPSTPTALTLYKPTSTIFTVSTPSYANMLPLVQSYLPDLSDPISLFWALAVLSTLVVLSIAYTQATHLDRLSYWAFRERETQEEQYQKLWATRSWWILSLLCDQWFRGLIPGDGMWTAENAASLRAKRDKSALRALVRMGIYPLFIQDGGGPTTTLEREGHVSPWGWITWPRWKQSKTRAVFEFVVPRGRGWMIEDEAPMSEEERERRDEDRAYLTFMDTLVWSWRLRRATRWRTAATSTILLTMEDLPPKEQEELLKRSNAPQEPFLLRQERTYTSKFAPDPKVPTEIGSTSRVKWFLPFKLDRILRGGWISRLMRDIANWLRWGFLLNNAVKLPIVRIEAPDDDVIELDKEILLIAQNLHLGDEWDGDSEAQARFDLQDAYIKLKLEPVEVF